jgi:bacterioferritin-associated ferredoxin
VLICHCRAVTDRAIRAAIEAGARTPAEVARSCRAGTGCGGCRSAVRQLLGEHAVPDAWSAQAAASSRVITPVG